MSLLYVKDPATTRFIAGTAAEAESLLGSPLPALPPPDRDGGRAVFAVRFHPQLHLQLDRFLQSLLREIGGESAPGRAENGSRGQADYEAALGRVLRAVRANDRRLGVLNLFWLAHSKAVAESLRDLQQRNAAVRQLKYSLHPLLSSFYRRLDQAARRSMEQADPQRAALLAGAVENVSLVDAIVEDGFAFTELGIANVDFNQFLAANKRYRLTADLFFEIYTLLIKETDRRLRENERGLVARVARHLPGLGREQSLSHAGLVKVMMNAHVLTYLLGDAWQTGSRLLASARIKAEAERRRPAEIVDAFLDLVTGVKRFEIVSHLRDQVCLLREGRDLDDRVSRMRLYEFDESAQVLNNAVNATVLFLDLRGFTQTSEGQISERDLTRELYEVFDAFIPHIRRFGGTVDKFLGDGIMVTYGTTEADPLNPLNALRSAILCQETIRDLRHQGKTYFKMGVAIHYGRVYLARFIADEFSVQTTVIGRNVNLAGRLSSAAKKALDEDEATDGPAHGGAAPEFQVTVDAGGVLFNEGIAISRDTLMQLEANLPLTHTDIGGYSQMEYFDEQVGRRIIMRYAGDAKFKGVRSSVPVYSVEFEG
ncbi:MAG TPA: adenylate/guanylate cyclase domain-containing protein [Vicinamibacteria bacterium]|nr:adenylate/guanylate cyclase domain-containing protein [Vicinamibacteria bacterium]